MTQLQDANKVVCLDHRQYLNRLNRIKQVRDIPGLKDIESQNSVAPLHPNFDYWLDDLARKTHYWRSADIILVGIEDGLYLSCAPTWVMLEYERSHNAMLPLQAPRDASASAAAATQMLENRTEKRIVRRVQKSTLGYDEMEFEMCAIHTGRAYTRG
jgi:hypothetical protein